MNKQKNSKKIIIQAVVIIAIYIAAMLVINSGILGSLYTGLLVPICVNIMLAVSLNLVTGFLGELSLGHACFMSIGAYTGSLLSVYLKDVVPGPCALALALIAGGVAAAIFGFLIGVPVLRLRGDYLAIVTLAFGEIVKTIINAIDVTGGAKGLNNIPKLTTYKNFTLVYIFAVLTIIIIKNFVNSRDGRAITAIRDNDIAAESVGIKLSTYKVKAFTVAACFAGIAGVIYAGNIGIIKPATFDYNKSIEILVIVVLGGMGSIGGSIIAAIILTVLPEMLRSADNLRMLIYAIVLIAMMIFNHSKIKQGMMNNKTLRKLFKSGREVK